MRPSSAVPVLLPLLLALAPPAAALEGRVVLHDGSPVAGAEVSVVGRTGHVLTDADGRFRLTPAPRPPFEVLVVLPGGRYTAPYRFEGPPAQPLVVEVASVIEESLTVTAGSAPSLDGPPASGTTLLTARELESRSPANLAQALENVAGAATVSEGQAAVPAIRGLSGGRTLILLDGARVTSERRVGPSATYTDPVMLEALEVSRGPGALAYGSDAFGGVIHMRTRRPLPGSGLAGRLDAALGAGTPQRRVALALGHGFERGGALLAVHGRNFEDWESPQGDVFNSGARDRGVLARLDHVVAGGFASVSWQGDFGRDIERPRDNSRTVRFFYPEEDSRRLNLSWERGAVGSLSRLGVTAFLGRYSLVTDQDRFATATTPRSVERAEVSASDFHVRSFAQRPLGAARLEAGLDVNGRTGLRALEVRIGYAASGEEAARSEVVSVDDARRVDAGVYASVDTPVGRGLSLAGGLRGDRVTSRNRGGHFGLRETDRGAVSGFASATLGPFRGLSTTVQVARGFRDPFLSDRYYRGPTGRGFITGSPDLESETSLQLDLAVRYVSGPFRSSVYAYQYRIHDLIERYETATDTFLFRNRGRARVRGVEAEAQVALPARVSLDLTGHWIRGEALDDDTPLDGIPPPTVTVRLRRDFGRAAPWVRLGAFGRLDAPGPTERERPGYALLDAGADVRLGDRAELRLLGRNLLDKAYRVSPDSRAVYAPGLAGVATVTLRF